MQIEDFLPKYPNVNKKKYPILNPYEDDFYNAIFRKKEFYDERLDKTEPIPTERGVLMKHQRIIARFLSSHTLYNELLLVHQMGTGKTCSAIGAIEQIKSENSSIKGAYIFAAGRNLLNNFKKELRDKCTGGQYVPEGHVEDQNSGCTRSVVPRANRLTDLELINRSKKLYSDFYHFTIGENKPTTFETFAKHLSRLKDSDIIDMYSNIIIIIDEVHNLRIQDTTEDKDRISMYEQFHRFLHLVKNCKILLLSGTPMKDSPDEIASIMNLILPLGDEQLPVGSQFREKYLVRHGENKYTIKQNKIKYLKRRFKGRVSFLKAMQSTVDKEFVGEKKFGLLKHFIVDPVQMSKFQTKAYIQGLELDRTGVAGVYLNSRQASLFVFPDGSYGGNLESKNKEQGFSKWVKYKKTSKTFIASKIGDTKKKSQDLYRFEFSEDMIKILKGKNNEETLKNIRKYSIKYATVIERILNAENQSCFVYSEFVTGSGAIVFAQLLNLFGFSSATGTQGNSEALRYGLLTNQTSTPKQISQIINCFNQPQNKHGKIIKVIIGSRLVSEGVSFYNVQQEFILTPWFNYSEIDQAIARGYRLGSHKELLKTEDPKVKIAQLVAIPRKTEKYTPSSLLPDSTHRSVDLYMYEISEDKDISIRAIMRLLMESAFDCALNYRRNHVTDIENERDCDYQTCEYVCDGIDMKDIEDELPINEIDDSTYQLYYANPKILPIRKKLEKLFKKYNNLDMDSIVRFFEGEYTEWEVRNAVKTILERSDENMFYKDYIQLYSRSNVQKIMIIVSNLFQTNFSLSLETILKDSKKYTEFEIITALKNMIDENIIIKNQYGFSSYLREYKNIYFLVNSLSITNDSFSEYYTRVPNIVNGKTFNELFLDIQIELLPSFIKKLCKVKKSGKFAKLIKSVPDEIQEMFIEAAVYAKIQNIDSNQIIRQLILDYFTNYIYQFEDSWVSNRLSDQDIFRCLERNTDSWKDCQGKYEDMIETRLEKRKDSLETNPWGYYGKYNPETGVFSIVNVKAQLEKFNKNKEKEIERLNKLIEKGEIKEEERDKILEEEWQPDFRDVFPGLNCRAGWGVPKLSKMAIRSLKIPIPSSYKKKDSRSNLLKILNKYIDSIAEKEYTKTRRLYIKAANEKMSEKEIKNIINKEWRKMSEKDKKPYYTHENQLYTREEVNNLSDEDIRRAIYFTHDKKVKSINGLCTEIEAWFRSKEWKGFDMLIPDKEAGTAGGHIKKVKDIKQTKRVFRLEKIVPYDEPEKFKNYMKDIEKLMFECFNIKKYKPDIDDKRWIFVFSRKKMVALLVIDNKNIIWNVCVAKNYRSMGIANQAVNQAVADVCPLNNPRLLVDNRGKTYNKLIKLYKSYGFAVIKDDGNYTTMEFKCEQ